METIPTRLLMYEEFMKFYGLKEIPGDEHNPIIVNWAQEIGHSYVKTDETAWCSIMMNYLAHTLKLERSGKLDARSWLNVGWSVQEPKLGHIVVVWREKFNSWKGHVGLYAGQRDQYVYISGGNQGNQAVTSPYSLSRVLGYRELRTLEEIEKSRNL